jgi:hypothetical protein
MVDRRCHDCASALSDSEGWIIRLDYPDMDPLFSTYDKVAVFDRCLLARRKRPTSERRSKSRDT